MNRFVKNPEKKMFWECFSYCGIGNLQPFERMLRSSQYIEVLRRRVFQSWKRGIVVVLGSSNRVVPVSRIENGEKFHDREECTDYMVGPGILQT